MGVLGGRSRFALDRLTPEGGDVAGLSTRRALKADAVRSLYCFSIVGHAQSLFPLFFFFFFIKHFQFALPTHQVFLLTIQYSPVKKKTGTSAGMPRPSGERSSPVANGAPNSQVRVYHTMHSAFYFILFSFFFFFFIVLLFPPSSVACFRAPFYHASLFPPLLRARPIRLMVYFHAAFCRGLIFVGLTAKRVFCFMPTGWGAPLLLSLLRALPSVSFSLAPGFHSPADGWLAVHLRSLKREHRGGGRGGGRGEGRPGRRGQQITPTIRSRSPLLCLFLFIDHFLSCRRSLTLFLPPPPTPCVGLAFFGGFFFFSFCLHLAPSLHSLLSDCRLICHESLSFSFPVLQVKVEQTPKERPW